MALTLVDSGNSFLEYTADGTIKDFPVTFPRLDAAHIFVLDNGTLKTIVTHYTEYGRDTPNKNYGVIRFGTAPANAHTVRIQRITPTSLVTHNPQVGMIEAIQAFFIAQESKDTYWPLPYTFIAADLSAAVSQYVTAPFDCEIKKVDATPTVQISTGGDITLKNGAGGSAVVGLTVTLANSAAIGTQVTDTPTAADATTYVKKGGIIEVLAAAAFNGGGAVFGNVWVKRANPT